MNCRLHFPFIIAAICLLVIPMETKAGGLGLFKRCKLRQTTYCPQPVPCPQAAPVPCVPCEKPIKVLGTLAEGEGIIGGQLVTIRSPCHANSYQAIYWLYDYFVRSNGLLLTFSTESCEMPFKVKPAVPPAQESITSDIEGVWLLTMIYEKKNGNGTETKARIVVSNENGPADKKMKKQLEKLKTERGNNRLRSLTGAFIRE